jgi:acid phosphatase type 7
MKMKNVIFALSLLTGFQLLAANSQYTLSFREDPATSIVIGWSGDDGTVYYGTSDLGTNFASYPLNKTADRSTTRHGINRRFARLSGLQPKTVYYFVIRDASGSVSARFKFKTLSDNVNDPVSFISGGDTRDGFKVFGAYVESCPSGNCVEQKRKGNRLVAKLRPDFVAFNGDFTMNQVTSNTNAEWNEWLNDWQLTISTDGRMYPMTFTQGNHEDNQDIHQIFDVPIEEYYALNINNGLIRMYMLNSELNACSNTAQLNWLTTDLQNHTNSINAPKWKFVQYHIPTFAMGNGYGLVSDQMSCWVNLFEQYGVKLCMESHTHITKWTLPCKKNSSETDFVPDPSGIVYIGEGNWGAPHRTLDFTGNNKKPYVRDQEVFDNFFYVRVNTDQTFIQCVKFENVEGVTAHTSDDLGKELPANVVLWNPSNGNQVVINNPIQGIENVAPSFSKVYPNPAKDFVKVSFDNHANGGKIEVYNALGKEVLNMNYQGTKEVKIALEGLPQGAYYIFVKTNDGKIQSHKVMKTK